MQHIQHIPRCLLIEAVPPSIQVTDIQKHFFELESLVTTYGGAVIDRMTQHRTRPHLGTYIGPGKVEEIQSSIKTHDIDYVILNSVTSSGQIFRLEKALWETKPSIRVWDRADLILEIFDQHATSREAQLQIALARLSHLGPRIYGLGGTYFSQQGGGIGTRGIGETNIELIKRHIKRHRQKITKELSEIFSRRSRTIQERKHNNVYTVALVGYTNAGKTSLYNLLTGKEKEVKHALFTTLDSTTGKIRLPEHTSHSLLVTDTIGFIDRLPTFLIDAFTSTLMESLHADILLHVVDGSDPDVQKKIEVVEDILRQLGVNQPPILVFNKLDMMTEESLESLHKTFSSFHPYFISVHKKAGIQALVSNILHRSSSRIHLTKNEKNHT